MKQVFSLKGKVVVHELPMPRITSGCVLVDVRSSLISTGSELNAIKGSSAVFSQLVKNPSLVKKVSSKIYSEGLKSTYTKIKRKFTENSLGYSCSGIVIAKADDVINVNVGDRVACAGFNYANHAEINCIPKNLVVRIPENVSFDEAAFVAIGAIALQGVRRAKCSIGENVAVMGLGLVGQITCQILNSSGCSVIGIDLSKERLDIAKSFGLETGFTDNVIRSVSKYTSDEGVDTVIVCAASSDESLIKDAITMCRKRGKIVIVGNVNVSVPWYLAYEKEIEILFSCSYGPGRYDLMYEERGVDYPRDIIRWTENRNMAEFLNLIARKKVNVGGLVGKVFNIDDAQIAYNTLKSGKIISALFNYSAIDLANENLMITSYNKKDVFSAEKINIALIGAGEFAKIKHLPNIRKLKELNLVGICSSNSINVKNVAKEFGVENYTTDSKTFINDINIDAVVITTRHDSHARIALDALNANKHVFLEKPMALNYNDLNSLFSKAASSSKVFTVGFNRRYSEIAKQAKSFLQDKNGPFFITYRVNAGELPFGHWQNDLVEGGGRIIGEACHFFDFFNWMIFKKPISIYSECISSDFKNILSENNIVSIVKYEDGSVATLIYNELGNNSLPKERIEIFRGGSNVMIDDFKSLNLDGKDVALKDLDKGHYNEFVEFINAIKGRNSELLNAKDAYLATLCSFKAIDSLKKGKVLRF